MKRLCLLLAVPILLLAACGDDADDDAATDDGADTTVPDEPPDPDDLGTVVIHMEPTDAIFIEGFEMGLRIDDPDTGEELKRAVWSEHAATAGGDPYTALLEQPLRPGPIRLGFDVNIGIGPGPEPPDLDADRLPCELEAEVVAGETIEVQVSFDDSTQECATIVES